jgi:hypothetical protein
MVSQNGTAGHTTSRIHEFQYPFPPQSILVMAPDGLGATIETSGAGGEDLTIVVVKDRPGVLVSPGLPKSCRGLPPGGVQGADFGALARHRA